MARRIKRWQCDVCQHLLTIAQFFALQLQAFSGERLLLEGDAFQAVGLQCANVAVVAALRRGQHAAVVLAEGAQRFFLAEAFQQCQAQGLARAFVLSGGVFHGAVTEGAGLVVVVLGDEGQGFAEGEIVLQQAAAQGAKSGHQCFPCSNAAFCSADASVWYLAFQSA